MPISLRMTAIEEWTIEEFLEQLYYKTLLFELTSRSHSQGCICHRIRCPCSYCCFEHLPCVLCLIGESWTKKKGEAGNLQEIHEGSLGKSQIKLGDGSCNVRPGYYFDLPLCTFFRLMGFDLTD